MSEAYKDIDGEVSALGSGGGAELTLTAGHAISAGDPVAVIGVGGAPRAVIAADYTGASFAGKKNRAIPGIFHETYYPTDYNTMQYLDDNKYVAWDYNANSQKVFVVTDNADGTLTKQTEYTCTMSYVGYAVSIARLSSTSFVIMSSGSSGTCFRICTVSGSVITVGSETTYADGAAFGANSVHLMGNGAKFCIVSHGNNAGGTIIRTFTWSGTTATLQNTTNFTYNDNGALSITKVSEQLIVVYGDYDSGSANYWLQSAYFSSDTDYTPDTGANSSIGSSTAYPAVVYDSTTLIFGSPSGQDAWKVTFSGAAATPTFYTVGNPSGIPQTRPAENGNCFLTTGANEGVVYNGNSASELKILSWDNTNNVLVVEDSIPLRGDTSPGSSYNNVQVVKRAADEYFCYFKITGGHHGAWFGVSAAPAFTDTFGSLGASLTTGYATGAIPIVALSDDQYMILERTGSSEYTIKTFQQNPATGDFQVYDDTDTITSSQDPNLLFLEPGKVMVHYYESSQAKVAIISYNTSTLVVSVGTATNISIQPTHSYPYRHKPSCVLLMNDLSSPQIQLLGVSGTTITAGNTQTFSYTTAGNSYFRFRRTATNGVDDVVWVAEYNGTPYATRFVFSSSALTWTSQLNVSLGSYLGGLAHPSFCTPNECHFIAQGSASTIGSAHVSYNGSSIQATLGYAPPANDPVYGGYHREIIKTGPVQFFNGVFRGRVPTRIGSWDDRVMVKNGSQSTSYTTFVSNGQGMCVIFPPNSGSDQPIVASFADLRGLVAGVASSSAAAGGSVTVVPVGFLAGGFTGLEPGVTYYIQKDGSISDNGNLWPLGVAMSSTEILVKA